MFCRRFLFSGHFCGRSHWQLSFVASPASSLTPRSNTTSARNRLLSNSGFSLRTILRAQLDANDGELLFITETLFRDGAHIARTRETGQNDAVFAENQIPGVGRSNDPRAEQGCRKPCIAVLKIGILTKILLGHFNKLSASSLLLTLGSDET